MTPVFFNSWQSVARVLIMTPLAYATMVIMLRISGKRTLAKMNAFDFVVTVSLGSSLATVALNKNIALAEGVVEFFVFIALQFAITWLSVRVPRVKKIVTSQPVLLLYKGILFGEVLKKERITKEEINVAAREQGLLHLEDIDIIILETTGDITIIHKLDTANAETLQGVKNYPR